MNWKYRCVVVAQLLAATALFSTATIAQQSPLSTHVPAIVANGQASAVSDLEQSTTLNLGLNLPLRNEAQLDQFLQDVQNPASPLYHQYLTVQQFTDRFGPTEDDYEKVVNWSTAHGFTVEATSPNRLLVSVSAPVSVVNEALHVRVKSFQHPTQNRIFYAPDREPVLDLGVQLEAITGLTNVNPRLPHYKNGNQLLAANGMTRAEQAITNSIGSGPNGTYLPSDMRAAYYGSGPLTGAGQAVAIFSFDGYPSADLQVYSQNTGFAWTVPVNNVLVAGYNGACFGFNSNGSENQNTCDDAEQILDIVNVIGMAPGLSQVLFYEGTTASALLNKMAVDNIAKVVSNSWGGGDFGTSSDVYFKEFQAQGITYLNATGDSGAFNASTYYPPSLDPYILQVGGTDLNTNGAHGSWSSETAWSDSGGGFVPSSGITIPAWQVAAVNATNLGSPTFRNSPDVAAEANFDNSTVINGQFETGYGGTSFATPRWAGYIALANQQSVANGAGTLGFVNANVYIAGLSSSAAANFHDITSGSNPPTSGGGNTYNAIAGYDLVTGWGSPNGVGLLKTLTTPTFTISDSPSSVTVIAGGTGSTVISVTPANGFTSAVTFSASGLPGGVTASFSPGSSTTGSTVELSLNGSASAGTYAVTLTGTSGSLSATTTVQLTVSSAGNSSDLVALNAGGPAVGSFSNDADYGSGTATYATGNGINTSAAANAAPAAVYQSERYASAFNYTIPGLTAGSSYTVRLHFAEIYWNSAGQRVFNVAINGTTVLPNFDIVATAGGPFIAVVKTFTAKANSTGQIVISFSQGSADNPKISGIEVVNPSAPVITAAFDSGGGAVGTFAPDADYSGGSTFITTATVTTAGVANAAPSLVYASERYGVFSYTIPGLTSGSTHTVRLHFAEIYWGSPGMRLFNVAINGTAVLSNFDIFAAAGGMNTAVVKSFTATANSSGQIVISFTNGAADNPKVSGIEVD